jgi:hypothetical protein
MPKTAKYSGEILLNALSFYGRRENRLWKHPERHKTYQLTTIDREYNCRSCVLHPANPVSLLPPDLILEHRFYHGIGGDSIYL